MKRSQINQIVREARDCFARHGWVLPPEPRWDVTDFGLGDFDRFGLVLINLAEEAEYCEKLMYARRDQTTPLHTHRKKKEDIICRHGELTIELWSGLPSATTRGRPFEVRIDGCPTRVISGESLRIPAGSRITLVPGIYHAFWPSVEETVVGEVSTANDDLRDNFFVDERVGRFPDVEEDEAAEVRLLSER